MSTNLKNIAYRLRIEILDMVIRAGGGHIGGSYSVIDILTVLYNKILKHDPANPNWKNRDKLIYSKGHSSLALYTILAQQNYFAKSELLKYGINGGSFAGHPEREFINGVEITSGSLGHGQSLGVGIALANKIDNRNSKVYVICSDGELNEGSVWEAIMSASQFNLNNLTFIIDYNKYISLGRINKIMALDPLDKKLDSFGWNVCEIDGHNYDEIEKSLKFNFENDKPTAIIANTIKGKGVSFMENVPMWHFRCPSEEESYSARKELEKQI